MVKKLLLISAFLISSNAVAQEYKWSVDASYPLRLDDDANKEDGAFDIGVKYRFVKTPIVNLGLDLTGGVVFDTESIVSSNLEYKNTSYLFQPKVFAEFNLPFVTRLHPSVGLGYSVLSFKSSGNIGERDISDAGADGGFSVDLGLAYDITKKLYVQVKYDYINLNVKGETIVNGESFDFDFNRGINRIKFGIGFRF